MVFKFVKKVVKGISKVVRNIGRGIKKTFKKIGKFMGKIGIIGQIGLALILPGVGQVLSGMLVGTGSTVGGLAGALQGMGAVGQAASNFIQGAVKVASNTSKFFSTVSDGVTKVVGDTIGAAAQSLGITAESAIGQNLSKIGINMDVDGWGGVFTNAEKSFGKITDAGSNIFNLDPLSEISVPQRALKEIPKDSLINEAPLREAIDSESALDALTKDRLQTETAMARVGGEPLLGGAPFGPVGTVDGVTYMSGPPPATAYGTTTAAQTAGVASETSLLDKTSKFLTGRTSDELLGVGRAKLADAATDFLPETGKSLGREFLAQASGLSPTAEEMTPRYYSSSVALGDMSTSIGVDTVSPYQGIIDQVGVQFASANPYGLMSQQYNFDQYQMAMKERGYA